MAHETSKLKDAQGKYPEIYEYGSVVRHGTLSGMINKPTALEEYNRIENEKRIALQKEEKLRKELMKMQNQPNEWVSKHYKDI